MSEAWADRAADKIVTVVNRKTGVLFDRENMAAVILREYERRPRWRVDCGEAVAGWFDGEADAQEFIDSKAFQPEACRIVYDEEPWRHPEWPREAVPA